MGKLPAGTTSDGGLSIDRRPFLKLVGAGAAVGFLGDELVDSATAASGTYEGIQVDFVTGTSPKNDLSTTYSSEGRLINWEWGERYGNTGEDMDKEPKSDTCEVTTTSGVEFDFQNNTATVNYSLSNCGGSDQDIALVAYDSPVNDRSNPGWDPANASDQELYDAVTTTTSSDGTLTVDIPAADQPASTTNHWRVNAGSGTTLTDAQGSLDASISSLGAWSWEADSGLDDAYLQCSSDSASGWSISGSASAFSHFPNGQGTIACAVYADAGTLGNRHTIFGSAHQNDNNSVFLGTWDSSALTFRIESGGSTVVDMDFGGSEFTEGAWHTVAVRCDGSTAYAYVDGQQVNTASLSNTASNSLSRDASIGTDNANVNTTWTGRIDDVWVSDQAVSGADVTTWHEFVADNYAPPPAPIARYDASTLALSDGDSVSSWPASVGNTDLSQSTSANQPTYQTNQTPEGGPAIEFSGGSSGDPTFLDVGSPLETGLGATISVRFRINDETVSRQVLAYNGSDGPGTGYGIVVNREGESDGGVNALYGGVSWYDSSTTITDDAWHTATLIVPDDGSQPALYLDGTPLDLDPQNEGSTANEPTDQFGIGQDGGGSFDPYLDGDIDELLVYGRPLSDSERRAVEDYLGATAPSRGLVGRYDASTLGLTDGDAVSSWAARTGSADLSQSTSANQPTFKTAQTPEGGPAVRFEGADDYVNTGSALSTGLGATISARFRIDDHTIERQTIAYNGSDDAGNGFGIFVNKEGENSGLLRVLYGGVSWWASNTTITDDAWYTATVIVPDDGSQPALYLNGTELDITPEPGGTASAPSGQFGIGQDDNSQPGDRPPYLDGDVDEVLVYDRPLSAFERRQVEYYLEGSSGPRPRLGIQPAEIEAYYSLDGSTATNAVTGTDASVTGSPTTGVTGQINSAFDFASNSDNGSPQDALTSGENLPLNGEGATVAAWLNYTSTETSGRPYQVGGSPSSTPQNGWNLEISDSDGLYPVTWENGTGTPAEQTIGLSTGTWYYIVTVVDGDTLRLHVFDTTGELSGSPQTYALPRGRTSAEPLHLMAGDGRDVEGRLDEVRAFSGPLTPSEVTDLYSRNGG